MKRFTFDKNESINTLFVTVSPKHGILTSVGPGVRVVGFDPIGSPESSQEWLESIIDHICSCYRIKVLQDAELDITIRINDETGAHTIEDYILQYFPFAVVHSPFSPSPEKFTAMVAKVARVVGTNRLRVMDPVVTRCPDIEQRIEVRGSRNCQCPKCPNLGALIMVAAYHPAVE